MGGVAPTSADDAQLTVASGNVTIDAGAVARSLDCTGYIGTLTHTAGVTLILGDATAGAGNVALKLVAGMTYTLGNVVSSALRFASTSVTQQTVDPGGKTFGSVDQLGGGSSYLLSGALTLGATATFTLQAGTFNTGNFAMSLGLFAITTATAKTLTLGSSAIAITGSAFTAVNYSGSNATFTANTAVMTLSGSQAGGSFTSANWNGLSLVFTASNTGGARLNGGPTMNNVTVTGPAQKTGDFQMDSSTTITGTFTANGNSTVNRIIMHSSTTGTNRTVTVTTAFSFTNVDFADITAAGAAGTWTGTSMGNALGNSNITFDAPATQTHTASAGGNWSDATKWTSRVPLPQDNVIVDVGTTGTLTADMPRLGADITFTGFAGTFGVTSVDTTMYGSLTLGSGMAVTTSGTFAVTFAARSAKTLTSSGVTLTPRLIFTAPSGTYTLVGNLVQTHATQGTTLTAGTLDAATNNVNVSVPFYSTSASTTTNMGTGVWTVSFASATPWNFSSSATVNASTSTIVIGGASASGRTFAGGGKTYGTLTYTVAGSTGSLTITGANTFNTINFSDATNARSLLFTAATTTTITNWNVNGTSGKLMTVDSATAATHTLTKPSGTVSSDYLNVAHSTATGGAAWYAGANSTNGGSNTGWNFAAPPTLTAGSRTLLGVGA